MQSMVGKKLNDAGEYEMDMKDVKKRVLFEHFQLGDFLEKTGYDIVRRPRDASQGLIKSNGFLAYHIVCMFICISFYYDWIFHFESPLGPAGGSYKEYPLFKTTNASLKAKCEQALKVTTYKKGNDGFTSLYDRYSDSIAWLAEMHTVTAIFQLIVACSKMYDNKRLVESLLEVVNVPINIALITYAMNQLFFAEKIISSCGIENVYYNHTRAWLWIECFLYWINVGSLMTILLSRAS